MQLRVDRQAREPLYRQIESQLRQLIVSGTLPGGYRLPSERELAEELGVNRTTVVSAYGGLAADGLVEGRVGRGTIVLGREVPEEDASDGPLAWSGLVRARPRSPDGGLSDRVAHWSSLPGCINLAAGGVDITGSPYLGLSQVAQDVMASRGAALLEDSPIAGMTELREELARRLRAMGCRDAAPGQILITSGTQQGLYLVARLLLDPGDVVLVESPAYVGTLSVLRAVGARTVGVPVDDQGMVVEAAEHYLSHAGARLIYTNPNFQNPTGSLMSPERRTALLRLSQRYQTPVLEDDLHGDLAFEGAPSPPLRALDGGGHVIYLGGLSSLLGSGLRLGWVLAPSPVVTPLLRLRQDMDLHPNNLVQMVVQRLLQSESFTAHRDWLCGTLRRRRDAILTTLSSHMPEGVRWSRPAGGLYLWCTLAEQVDAADLLERAGEMGVTFAPGALFSAQGGGDGALRLAFGLRSEREIAEGVRRLAAAVDDVVSRPSSERSDPSLKRAFV